MPANFDFKKKSVGGNEWPNIFPKSSQARKKPPPPMTTIRRNRRNDPHGGVATYFKNNLFCKCCPDLQVNNLEAVWAETKMNQESMSIRSVYRPQNAKANCWELIITLFAENDAGRKKAE